MILTSDSSRNSFSNMHTGKILLQSILWRGLYYVSAFIINILIARHFQASVSGTVYYISSLYALVLLLFSLSLESGMTYFASKQQIPVSKLFNFSMIWSVITGVVTFFITWHLFGEAYEAIPGDLIIFSAVAFITGNLLITYCSAFFYSQNEFVIPNIIIISGTIILIALIPYNGRSVVPVITNENYFYIYFASFFAQGIVMAVAVKIKYIKAAIFQFLSAAEFRSLFRYCALAFLGNIIFFLLYRIDYFFVEKYCTADELGSYIQVSKIVHLFFILPTILASALFPITASGRQKDINKLLTLLSRSIFLLYSLVCMLLALAGKWLFPFVFGESFTAMYQPFLWLIPGILSLSGIFTLTAYFAGRNRIKVNIIGSVYALVVIVAGDIFFIPKYGIEAAAIVSSSGYIVYQIYIIAIFSKEYKTAATDFFIFRSSDWKHIKQTIIKSLKK